MLLLAIPAGLVIGLSLGALGGGGSILTVPVLVYVLGQNAHDATTASLAIVGVTALAGVIAHARAGRVRLRSGLTFGVAGVAGSFAGSRLSAGVSEQVLLTAFACLMLAAAAAMTMRSRRGSSPNPQARAGAQARRAGARHALRVVAAATVVGLLTGFFGVGGGFIVVPALVFALGFQMPAAVGTSLLVIVIASGSALLARIGTPVHLDWALLAVFTGAAIAGTAAGSRVATGVRPQRLELAFAALLAVVAVYTGARALPGVL